MALPNERRTPREEVPAEKTLCISNTNIQDILLDCLIGDLHHVDDRVIPSRSLSPTDAEIIDL